MKLDTAPITQKNADGDAVNVAEANTEGPLLAKVPEGLPGSEKSVACVKRDV